jgi:ribonuclease G
MAKELIVCVNGREKKIAIIENEKVTEFYIERGEENQGIVGNIYKGRVMRVLPGMQSAFVDIGLERDAFLYVSDFFDEEEEFERIVIDKSKKGEVSDVQRLAAEEIAQARVEKEHQIDLAHERLEPMLDSEEAVSAAAGQPETAEEAEGDGSRRRGRRSRRRGRSKEESEIAAPPAEPFRRQTEDINTPFVAGDPSIQRIVDEEETSGELFKDARLQERIFDQIHAVEFNLEDDFRTAEVGSLLSESAFGDPSFQRIDDSDIATTEQQIRTPTPVEAHLDAFVEDLEGTLKSSGSFERVSDDEEAATQAAATPRRGRRSATAKGKEPVKKSTRKATTKASAKKSSTKRAAKKRSSKASEGATEDTDYADSEARVSGNRAREEFATRRGGRRRRRPSKQAPGQAVASDSNGKDESEPTAEIAVQEAPVPQEPRSASTHSHAQRRPAGRGNRGGFSRRDRQQPAITDLLREGQEILVQIAKEPIAKKGARITSHIALPGRFLVYMPTVEHVGVSRKIESDNERIRLRKLIQQLRAEEDVPSGGFIVRTAGVGIAESDLREDVRYLVRTWLDIRSAAEKSKPASLVHRDLDLVQRILRDQLSDDFAAIRVDSEEEYEAIVEFVNRIQPRMVNRVKLYTRDEPILEKYGVQAEVDKAIKPRVWLKSGGYLVINQTEALVAIDVNTGKFVGRGSGRLEDTITRTNLEAVDEIVRQIRLRDLGGIIVLDLIDMEERRNRTRVMQALQEALRNDKSPTKVLSFNDFGLVIMTRKRVKQSLERTLCAPCQYCQGAGLIKSAQTVCYELLEEARRLGKTVSDSSTKQATLRIHPEVARALRSSERDVLNEIEAYLGSVDINSDPSIHQEQFDYAFI